MTIYLGCTAGVGGTRATQFGTVSTFEYSNEKFSIAEYLKDGMLMCPQRSIFEIKYPEKDIVGSAK